MPLSLLLSANTMMELDKTLKEATETLVRTEEKMIASVTSGCEIFVKFITLTKLELAVTTFILLSTMSFLVFCCSF